MQLIMLDGCSYKFIPKTKFKKSPKSSGHLRMRTLLKELFPTINPVEECPIKIKKGKTLYLDFYLPILGLAIEIDGRQHSSYSIFMHGSKLKFLTAQQNDRLKEEFCELNNIKLIRLLDNDDEQIWKEKILNE